MPCRMIDGCLTNSKSGDFDWRCWSACTSTYYTGPCSDPINADQGTPFSYRFPKDITSVFSLVFSIIMCILSLWVSSLFEGNRELSCVSGTREEARDPRISSPLACSLACYRVPRLALLATRNGELVLRILYSWHFSQYISNDIHEENVSLVDDYCFS